MTLNDLIINVIDKGIVVRILYNNNKKRQYKYIISGKWAHIYKKENKGQLMDALLEVPTTLETTIDTVEYIFMPAGFNLRWFLSQPGDIKTDSNLYKGTKDMFTEIQEDFNNYLYSHIGDIEHLDFKALKDEFFIRNYPVMTTAKNKKQLLNDIRRDIIEKYFIVGANIDEIYTLPACTRVGLSFEHFKSNDKNLINCCRRKWFNIIEKEVNNLIGRLKYDIKNIQSQKNDAKSKKAIRQLRLYIKMLKNINKSCLRKCSTIEEILSFWPSLMQPKPLFVYDR